MSRSTALVSGTSLVIALAVSAVAGAQSSLPAFPAAECATRASRATRPFAEVFVGTTCVDLTRYVTSAAGGGWSLVTPVLSVGSSQFAAAAAFGALEISFATETLNETATPVTYAFLFGTPTPVGSFTTLTAYGEVEVTSQGTAAVMAPGPIFPTFLSAYFDLNTRRTHADADLGTAPCVAPADAQPVTAHCSFGTRTTTFAPIVGNALELLFTYTQSGAGSIVGFTTAPAAPPTTTPEPTSLTLSLLGLGCLGLLAGRRRSSRRGGPDPLTTRRADPYVSDRPL